MKKILMIIALAGALVAGATAVMTFHSHQAVACEGSGCPWAPSL